MPTQLEIINKDGEDYIRFNLTEEEKENVRVALEKLEEMEMNKSIVPTKTMEINGITDSFNKLPFPATTEGETWLVVKKFFFWDLVRGYVSNGDSWLRIVIRKPL